jgi:glycerol-3-phosphate dehydrogenase
LDHPELRSAIGDHEFFFENKDGRIVLIFPLGDRVLVGTSDIRIDDPDDAIITDDEVQYFFDMIKRVFPKIPIDKSHIVFTFSGVRPLARSSSHRTGQITRDHKIEKFRSPAGSFPVYSLIGGKWTTFRAFAEKMSNMAMQELNLNRRVSTREVEFGGGRNYPKTKENQQQWIASLATRTGLPLTRIETLFSRYGTRSEEIAEFISGKDDHQLLCYPCYSSNEIDYIVRQEDVTHLDDFLLRRSMIGMLGRITADGLNELALVIGKSKNWEESKTQNEIQRTINILKSKHRMDFAQYLGD